MSEDGKSWGAGGAVEAAKADDRRLIALVRARPLLFERNTLPVANYYAQVKSLWKQVAENMGWTVAEVRRKWSHIRNSYSRHLRNQVLGARTGRGRAVSRWYLADELLFLRDHMATDTRQSLSAPTMVEMESSSEARSMSPPWLLGAARSVDVKSERLGSSPGVGGAGCAGGAEGAEGAETAFEQHEDCSYFQFFRGLYGDYQALTTRRQRAFKRRCLDALHRLLDEQDALDTLHASPPCLTLDTLRASPPSLARLYQAGAINLSSSVHHEPREPCEPVYIAPDDHSD